jgi:heterodisulfide reductase subunit C
MSDSSAACFGNLIAKLISPPSESPEFRLEFDKRRTDMAHATAIKKGTFLAEVIEATPNGERLLHCMQCGSCGGSCPSGGDMEYTPRAIFALIQAEQREAVLSANTQWACVSCYFCTTRCPQNIPITDIMYTIKRMAIAENAFHGTSAPALAKTFTDLVEKYGRSYELGLATWYYMLNRPIAMMKMGPMGSQMFFRGRMSLTPTKIKNIDQLRSIIRKAGELSKKK